MIDITGINLVVLIQKLYKNSVALGMGRLHHKPEGLTPGDALHALSIGQIHDGYHFDYVYGHPFKIRIKTAGDCATLDREALFDRDAGEGACQRAVDEARQES